MLENKKVNISIIVPTFNEEKDIRACLDAVFNNDYGNEFIEVILIDGGSKDKTIEIVESFKNYQRNIKVIVKINSSVYEALNVGLNEAKGEYVVRVDARSLIPTNYISKCIANLSEYHAMVAGGVQEQYGKDIYQRTIAEVLKSTFGTGGAKFRQGGFSGYVDTVYLGVFKKKTFDAVGKYDDDGIVVSEDSMMNDRISKIGGKIYLDGGLKVQYPAKRSIRELFKQYFIYGGAKAHTFLKYKRLTAFRQYGILFACLMSMITLLLTLAGVISFIFPAFFVALYAILVLSSSTFLSIESKNSISFLYSICIYPTIHFGWVMGFLARFIFGKSLAPYFFTSKKKINE